MGDHEPTISPDRDHDGSVGGGGGHSDALDAELLPEEFPDERPLASRDYGTTEAEQARRESLDRRLRREEPDLTWGDEDEPASEDADDGDDESPELLDVSDEEGHDEEEQSVTVRGRTDRHRDDSGQTACARSAEEDAIHVVDQDRPLDAPSDFHAPTTPAATAGAPAAPA